MTPFIEKLPMPGYEIVRLYLEKHEQLSEREKDVLIETIHMLNKPLFVSNL